MMPQKTMIIYPAIDLKDGLAVRLEQGDMARATVYGDDPAHRATLFAEAGAGHLHVVDLDGARGGKLIGAGGGGFLMFYAEDKTRLRAALRRAGLREVRFRFDFQGTRVVAAP